MEIQLFVFLKAFFQQTNSEKMSLVSRNEQKKMKSFWIVLIWMIFVVLPQNTKHTIFTTS